MTGLYKEVEIPKKPPTNHGIKMFSLHKTPCQTVNMKTLIDTHQDPSTVLSYRSTDDKYTTPGRKSDPVTDKDTPTYRQHLQPTKVHRSETAIFRHDEQRANSSVTKGSDKTHNFTGDRVFITSALKKDNATELDSGKLQRRKTFHITESIVKSRHKAPVFPYKDSWMNSGRTQIRDKPLVAFKASNGNGMDTAHPTCHDRKTSRSSKSRNENESTILPELEDSKTDTQNQSRPLKTYTVQIAVRKKQSLKKRKQTFYPSKAGGVIYNKGIVIQQKENEKYNDYFDLKLNLQEFDSPRQYKRQQLDDFKSKSASPQISKEENTKNNLEKIEYSELKLNLEHLDSPTQNKSQPLKDFQTQSATPEITKENESNTISEKIEYSDLKLNIQQIDIQRKNKKQQLNITKMKSGAPENLRENNSINSVPGKSKFDAKERKKSSQPNDNLNAKIKDIERNSDFVFDELPSKNTVVAAIDFGTSYSGYAFSSKEEYVNKPLSVTAKFWTSPHYNTIKTSTSILFDENRNFHSFGFEAEAKYLRLLGDENENADDWYFFTRFKMILYQNMNIGMNTKVRDNMGKQMSALKVFSAAIAYMKADLLAMCQESYTGFDQEDIHWVLTVPALWNDKAKTFMREAARKAGIPNDKLIMALEPEAASLYCLEWMKRSDVSEFHRGEKFMVLDAGGGTVDIAVHQIQDNGKIRELHRANGGDWGGIQVDHEFKKLLEDIIGRDVLYEIEKENRRDYFDILYSFEKAKRRDFSIVGHGKVQLAFPNSVNRLCLKIQQKDVNVLISENERLDKSVRLIRDKLEIDMDFFKTLFSGAITNVVSHLTTLFRKSNVKDVTTILIVGGFSECYILQEAIQGAFNTLNVIVPQDSSLAVLKGAVLYGHSPRIFQSRISTFTYGIETTEPFTEDHPLDKKIDINGSYHCDKIFCIHVKDGETVTLGKSVSKTYRTIDPDQTHMEFIVYASTKKHPKFTDDDSCFRVGTLTVDVSHIASNKFGEKKVKLELIYGGTELEAVATDLKTGKTSREHFKLGIAKAIRNNDKLKNLTSAKSVQNSKSVQ